MGDAHGVLPVMDNVVYDFIHPEAVLDLRKHERAVPAHEPCVALHHAQIRTDGGGQIRFVDDQKVRLRDARAAFARDFVTPGNVNDVDGVIGQLAAEVGGQVVAAGFQQHQVGVKLLMEFLQRQQVGGNVFADGRMWTAAGFHGPDALGFQRLVADEEFAVFPGENVIGDGSDVHLSAQLPAQREHQCRLAAAHRPAHPDRERTLVEIAMQRLVAFVEMAGVVEVFVRVAMAVRMGIVVAMVVVVMRMGFHGQL